MDEKMEEEIMDHQDKINWMIQWAHKNKLRLELEGECGFARKCVGVVNDTVGYPSYEWFDKKTYKRLDKNGDVWTPEDAYHNHPCVAVLGRGMDAESQLYDWLKWFEDNNFVVETGLIQNKEFDLIEIMLGQHEYARMVKS